MMEFTETFASKCLNNERTIWTLPPRDSSARSLAIFLDAELYRDRVGAVTIVEELSRRREVADSWFVFVSFPEIEARWRECPCHSPFAEFISEELLPWLSRKYPMLSSVSHRVLIGLSYSGLAAAYLAKQMPGVFQKVICQSGSFWWDDCRLIEEYRKEPINTATDFYLDVGLRETRENIRHREDVLQVVSQVEGVKRFRDVLVGQGRAVSYIEFDAGHDFAAWKETLPNALRWALPNQA